MNCSDARSLLHGYIDRELDLEGVLRVDAHLKSCAGCKGIYDQYAALQSAVRKHAAYHAAPAMLADRVRANLRGLGASAPARAARPQSRWQWLPSGKWFQSGQWLQVGAAVAATFTLTWMAALQLNGPSQDDAVLEQVIAGYARSELTGHGTDVATSDQHTVKPWLSGRLDFSLSVMDLTSAGFPLVGGRLDYLDNRPVAALVYRHRQHVINLFVWPHAKGASPAGMQPVSKRGYNVLHWVDAGMTYWAISDVDPADLRMFADTYASAR